MIKPYVIGISGESGVGKSTISELVSLFYGTHDSLIISTDDLHKWERSDEMWKTITHLNPEANNLELGDNHLCELANGKTIYRSIYNHERGYFNPPVKIEPKKIIIIEGLHAFFTDFSKQKINLKIFVDTDEDLKTHWKILRDTEERGYKYNVVLDVIHKRKLDSENIKLSQINVADVVIKINTKNKIENIGDKNEKIELKVEISKTSDLFSFIQNSILGINNFTNISKLIGDNLNFCQDGGGNISFKLSDKYMVIKSSGFNVKDTYKMNGYSIVDFKQIINDCKTGNNSFDNILLNSVVLKKYKKPSMETGFHAILDKYVIHIHPIYLTTVLCLENSKLIIEELFSNIDYNYIEYIHPGFKLYELIKLYSKKKVYFLENHGVIISFDNIEEIVNLLNIINDKSKKYLQSKCDLQNFDLSFCHIKNSKNYAFPDAIIFADNHDKKEILSAHNYINLFGNQAGQVRYLSSEDIYYLKNMEAEKYRKMI